MKMYISRELGFDHTPNNFCVRYSGINWVCLCTQRCMFQAKKSCLMMRRETDQYYK